MTDQAQGSTARLIAVWDLPTRIFHWALAVIVIIAYFTGDDDIPEIIIHTYLGYAVGALLMFRVIWGLGWGIGGNRYARFGDFIKPWPVTRDYARQLIRLSPPRYVGHNPLGGLMILAMIVVLAVIVVTGMGAAIDEGVRIAFLDGLPGWMANAAEELHEGAAELIMIMAGVHVAGVVVDSVLTGDNLIKAMITGAKIHDKSDSDPDSGPDAAAPPVGAWRALVLAGLTAAAWGWLIFETSF
ncbi:MAG: cytochrome B [Rhodospirillaceae bacterium]|nr:cytochrome B [Rhodospirillaceae bacterium]MBT5664715.1 cytochrome B [Rhodospirillaceae bacterium]